MKRKFDQITKSKTKGKKKYTKKRNRKKRRIDHSFQASKDKKNPLFEMFYTKQKIFQTEEEYKAFFEIIKEPLPITFRVSLSVPDLMKKNFQKKIQKMSERIEKDKIDINLFDIQKINRRLKYLNSEENKERIKGKEQEIKKNTELIAELKKEIELISLKTPRIVSGIKKLDFAVYKDLAYQLDVSKNFLGKYENDNIKYLRKFLVAHSTSGNITRQELVSMIPPIVFDIKSSDKILDLCSAPGSKTSELLEILAQAGRKEGKLVTGFVVANDIDRSRVKTLIHQVQRLKLDCANVVFTNNDGRTFPFLLSEESKSFKFNCILADVMCSGDGTIRKNAGIWGKWTPEFAWSLHPLQSQCLFRSFKLLEDGGQLVYSTCSMNPIENEAVVAALLRAHHDEIELVDISDKLNGLVYSKGFTHWKIFDIKGEEIIQFPQDKAESKGEKVINPQGNDLYKSFFPPTEEEVKKFNLDRCVRFYPNQQNNGGFFIAKFRKKLAKKPTTNPKIEDIDLNSLEKKQKKHKGISEFKVVDESIVDEVYNFFGIDKSLIKSRLFSKIDKQKKRKKKSKFGFEFKEEKEKRIKESRPRKLYLANPVLTKIKEINEKVQNWNIGALGTKVFEVSPVEKSTINYRLTICGTDEFYGRGFITKRILKIEDKSIFMQLMENKTVNITAIKEGKDKEEIMKLSNGSVIITLASDPSFYFLSFKTNYNFNKSASALIVSTLKKRFEEKEKEMEIDSNETKNL